jgi:uncharacterized damage-inducible protein DinB
MSETITRIDAKAELANWTRRIAGMYVADLKALDESAITASAGGAARTAQEFTAEVAGFNLMVAKKLRGEEVPERTDEDRAAFSAQFSSKEVCVSMLSSSAEELAGAIEFANEESMAEEVTLPWGETMSKWALANLCANHILYHDGQLNFIQSLNGDAEMHWFDQ